MFTFLSFELSSSVSGRHRGFDGIFSLIGFGGANAETGGPL